jgi:pyridoxal phosphate enzyme (YggS family)
LKPLQYCIQVNIDAEQTKSGVWLDQLPELVKHVVELPNIQLRGLMAIPKPNQDPEQQRQAYRQLADALKQLQENWPALDTLSMGMSADMDSAIAEGATILRIGTALFGPRNR